MHSTLTGVQTEPRSTKTGDRNLWINSQLGTTRESLHLRDNEYPPEGEERRSAGSHGVGLV